VTILHRTFEHLDGTGIDRELAGGKAWALDRLIEHGFAVPEAFVIHSTAYQQFVTVGPIAARVAELSTAPLPPAPALAAEEAAIEAAFLEHPLPADTADEVVAGVSPLLARGRLAVRSSATAEDMDDRSFAGQYRSYLDVDSVAATFDAIRRCWASLWFPGARAYRRKVGIAAEDQAMAVIIQQQIPAQWSGVIFTCDPQGDGSTLRVEAVPGMGEQLVSGRVTPADFVIDRHSLGVIAGHHRPPPYLEDIARLGLRIERRMGEPQDVEWSVESGQLWVLQSRPITVGAPLAPDDDGFDTPVSPDDVYTPEGIGEMLPGVIPPLVWSINRPMLDAAFRSLFGELGSTPPMRSRPVVGRFRGRAAVNLSVLRDAAATMPASSAADVDGGYLGPNAVRSEPAPPDRARVGLRALIRNWKQQRRVEHDVQVLCTAVSCLPVIEPDPADLGLHQLLGYRRELRDLAWRGTAAELAASAAAASMYRTLELLLCRWLGDEEGRSAAQLVTSGALRHAMVGPNRVTRLRAVIDDAATPALRRVLTEGGVADVKRRLIAAGGLEFVVAVEEVARSFGSIAVYGGPSFTEVPERLWDLVRSAVSTPTARTPRSEFAIVDLIDAVGTTRKWRTMRLLSGQIVDLRRRLLLRLSSDVVRFLTLREQAKGALLALGGMERRVVIEGAQRLVRSGHLDAVGDVELFSDGEFEGMLRGGEVVTRVELRRRAVARLQAQAGCPLPATFVGYPGSIVSAGSDGGLLEGWAASAGLYRGAVRRVDGLEDGDTLEPGEVLVANSTDASWTPLFLRAGALVLERGGPLSHAAIVARELGVPAVLNVPEATRLLRDGAMVEVDGIRGVVRLLTDSDAHRGSEP
jgi:pyruvate,water dikinase